MKKWFKKCGSGLGAHDHVEYGLLVAVIAVVVVGAQQPSGQT